MNLRGGSTNLTEEEYGEICNYSFSVRNVEAEAWEKCSSIVSDFCYDYLTESQLNAVREMSRDEKIGFGIDLYQSLMYDSHIMDEKFRDTVKKFPGISASPSIDKSVDGDVRVFFE